MGFEADLSARGARKANEVSDSESGRLRMSERE
jgi:hypothetical protein